MPKIKGPHLWRRARHEVMRRFFGGSIAVISGFAWRRFMRTYLEVVLKYYTALRKSTTGASSRSPAVAAPPEAQPASAGAVSGLTSHAADALPRAAHAGR